MMNKGLTSTRIAAVALAGMVALNACASAQGDSEEQASADQPNDAVEALAKVVNVAVTSVELSTFTDFIRITADVEAYSDVTLSAEETGVIERYLVDKGERVRQGQVIVRLDSEMLQAQVDEARAAATLAQEQYERQRRLWEDEQIGSEITYLQTKYQAEMQRARLHTLETRLAKTSIRSPIAGVFDEKFLEAGEMAVTGASVVRVVAIDRLKVTGGVPERFAPSVDRDDGALITFDVLPDQELRGAIDFVGNSVDERSRTFPIEIVIDNPGGMIKPQMVANVQLERSNLTDVVVVPQEVVIRTADGYQVYVVVDRNGTTFAEARPVQLGPSYADRVVINEGLEPGEQLIAAGAQLVDDGSRVHIVGESRE